MRVREDMCESEKGVEEEGREGVWEGWRENIILTDARGSICTRS